MSDTLTMKPWVAEAQAFTPAQLSDRTLHRRAVEAINWGIAAVGSDLMLQAALKSAGAKINQIVFWSHLPDWKNQTLTPNPDSIYFMPFFSTAEVGPLVLEIPPADDGSITGSVMDWWQVPLEDVGPAGVDRGKGGKYLILPPGRAEPVPDGYIALPSATFQGYGLLRSILKSRSDGDIEKAVAYGKRIRLYPLSQAADPPMTVFVDAVDVVLDSTVPYDLRFFQSLDRVLQTEPWIDRDRVMIDMLKSIGLEKGRPFRPDAKTIEILEAAAQEALARFDVLYETIYEPHNAGTRWFLPADKALLEGAGNGFTQADSYPIDARGTVYYCAFSGVKHMGAGQFYLFVTRDLAGGVLDGSATYRLRVPANPPVKQYWSVTLYDFATHALIRDVTPASRSSQSPGLKSNADGSVDIVFGPKPPEGQAANWVPTKPGGRFEALFRFYGPEPALFEKTWVLPDIEKITP
jgi:hypothetical protein